MPSSKTPVKIRIEAELAQELHQLHPGYGEASRVVQELVMAYLAARRFGMNDALTAVTQAVKGRTA